MSRIDRKQVVRRRMEKERERGSEEDGKEGGRVIKEVNGEE